jgi:hypothetical protein
MSTDESPDTEEQLTSQDFIKEGPIERGVSTQLPDYVEVEFVGRPILSMHPEDARAVMTRLGARADMFKAMALEADKEAKRLEDVCHVLQDQLQSATLSLHISRTECVDVRETRDKYRAALLDIEGRITNWADDNWLEPGMAKGASVLVANILAVVRRVK